MTVMNRSDAQPSLDSLIERSGELKGALVSFVCGPRFERHLARFFQESASPGEVLDEGGAASIVDRFALQHRLPNGKTVLRKPGFTWAEHGEALLRRRKPWYYEREPRPGVSVIGARLSELAGLR
jgi:hypothetical protein